MTSQTHVIKWPESLKTPEEWLQQQPHQVWKEDFNRDGFVVINNLLDENLIEIYRDVYNQMLEGKIDANQHRHDLGAHEKQKSSQQENVCQIMWPSLYVVNLTDGPIHKRAQLVAKLLLGDDMDFDFDMLVHKAPFTNTCVPWHQDEGYWPDMPDKRAVTVWVALDNATVDNGCMWFVPGSNLGPLRPHRPVKPGFHTQMCDCSESEGKAYPIPAGSCSFHSGRTLHYTRGNTTDRLRRAFSVNYRPRDMVTWERQHDFDHGKIGLPEDCVKHGDLDQ